MANGNNRQTLDAAITNSKPAEEEPDVVQVEEEERITEAEKPMLKLSDDTKLTASAQMWAEKLGAKVTLGPKSRAANENLQKQIETVFKPQEESETMSTAQTANKPKKNSSSNKATKKAEPKVETEAAVTTEDEPKSGGMEIIHADAEAADATKGDEGAEELQASEQQEEAVAEVNPDGEKKTKKAKAVMEPSANRMIVEMPFLDCLRCAHLKPDAPAHYGNENDKGKVAKFRKAMPCLDNERCPAQLMEFHFIPFGVEQVEAAVQKVYEGGDREQLDNLYDQAKELSASAHDRLQEMVKAAMRKVALSED